MCCEIRTGEVFGFGEKLWWKNYCLVPGIRDNGVHPGGPKSEFLLQQSVGISPGLFPDSSVESTLYLAMNPFILKIATEKYIHLQGGLWILLGKSSSQGEKQPDMVNLTWQQSLCHQKNNSILQIYLLGQHTKTPI